MAIDISKLKNKKDGDSLSAKEFTTLVEAVQAEQNSIKTISVNGVPAADPDAKGNVNINFATGDYETVLTLDCGERILSADGKVKIGVRFSSSSVRQEGSEVIYTPTYETARLRIMSRIGTDISADFETKLTIPKFTSVGHDSTSFTYIDLSDILVDGVQTILFSLDSAEISMAQLRQQVTITKANLSLESAIDWENAKQGDSMELKYFIRGAIDKTLHLKVSGKTTAGKNTEREISIFLGQLVSTQTPYSYQFKDSENDPCKVMSIHGIHKVEAWLSASDGDDNVESNHETNEVMVVADETDDNIYLMLQNCVDRVTNYVTTKIVDWAIYNPQNTPIDVVFSVGNFSQTKEYLTYKYAEALNGNQYSLVNAIEIENDVDNLIDAYLRVSTDDTMLVESPINIKVDNTEKFSPTGGADFYLNPKLRNNNDADRDTITNAAKENEVIPNCVFNNFSWITDGWITDEDNQRCLRVLAGSSVVIPYEAYSEYINTLNSSHSLTIELDFKVRNVTDENKPIFRMCSYDDNGENPIGLELKPIEGVFMTSSKKSYNEQNFGWQEGVRTHLMINIVHNLRSDPNSTKSIPYIRVFINGIINREFIFNTGLNSETEFFRYVNGIYTSQGIRIGQDSTDVDIYSIRIYKKALSSNDCMQNYLSALPTSDEKIKFREANKITGTDGTIDYNLAKQKYNVLLWHGKEIYRGDQAEKQGNLDINILNQDGSVDKEHSGTLTDAY